MRGLKLCMVLFCIMFTLVSCKFLTGEKVTVETTHEDGTKTYKTHYEEKSWQEMTYHF